MTLVIKVMQIKATGTHYFLLLEWGGEIWRNQKPSGAVDGSEKQWCLLLKYPRYYVVAVYTRYKNFHNLIYNCPRVMQS